MSTRCITPFNVKHENQNIPVPCGKCPPCAKRKVSGWSYRLVKQGEVSTSALFVTLTYDTTHVPITSNGFMNLDKRDIQLWMKKLRKLDGTNTIKYYLVGEYGGKTLRPHYHVILFNASAELVCKTWHNGQVHIGEVNGASIGYTLKYMAKKGRIPMHANDDRQKEFALMSKGLGKNYLTQNMHQWHNADQKNRYYVPLENKKIPMPRYYKDKIYTKETVQMIGQYLQAKAEKEEQKLMDKHGNNYYFIKAEKDKQMIKKFQKSADKGTTL